MKNKKIIIIASVLAVVAVGGFFLLKKKGGDKATFRETKVSRGDLRLTILSSGTVLPENRLEIRPPIVGRIEQVLVNEGQRVKKGQILAWMSSTERAALLDVSRSKGEEEYKKWEELYKPTPVLAPINGTIILRNVEAGQSFTSSDAILVMSNRLTVKAQVDETDIAQIQLKQNAEIVLDAYASERIEARVEQVAFEAKTVNNVTTYTVDVLPLEVSPIMRAGMTANVTFFVGERENVLLIPSDAIRVVGGRSIVTVRTPDGKDTEREVTLGISNGRRIELVSGLEEGEVVLSQQMRAKGATGTNPFSPMGGGRRGGGGGRGGR